MPARIVLVHNEPGFVDELATVLRLAGQQVATFADPLAAWDALEAAQQIEVLITSIEFPPGRSNGIALARMVHVKRPNIRVLFAALPKYTVEADGLGVLLPLPLHVPGIVDAVKRILETTARNSQ